MANDGLTIQGIDTLVGVLQNAHASASPAFAALAMRSMMKVFLESQKQVPVDHGILKASGHIEGPDLVGGKIEISIGYGGASAPYALFVHENLTAHHKPPTKAKYLEDPMNAANIGADLGGREMEAAILGQYPQSPAIAHNAETVAATEHGYDHASMARRRSAVAHARAFTASDIHGALARASAHPGRMVRKRRGN